MKSTPDEDFYKVLISYGEEEVEMLYDQFKRWKLVFLDDYVLQLQLTKKRVTGNWYPYESNKFLGKKPKTWQKELVLREYYEHQSTTPPASDLDRFLSMAAA